MKNISLIGYILSLLLFSACNSTPSPETHYFVLNPNQSTTTNKITLSEIIELQPIQLTKFLDQPGIVLQTNQHEIKVAHFHRWAEPLKINIHRYISQSIGIRSTKEPTQSLGVHIQQFHGAQDGSALMSGYWEIDNELYRFSYQAPLTKTGYAELVKQLALLLDQLCADIADQIN